MFMSLLYVLISNFLKNLGKYFTTKVITECVIGQETFCFGIVIADSSKQSNSVCLKTEFSPREPCSENVRCL